MPRKETGEWVHLDPLSERGFVQANAWQATFGLSHDIETLARLMGGNDSLATQLNYVFEMSKMQDSCLVMLVMPINPVARMRTFSHM